MRTVHITYPGITKIQLSSKITFHEETTLREFQSMVLNDVWTKFRAAYPHIKPHGAPEQVQLWDEDHEVLLNTDSWQTSERMLAIFEKTLEKNAM